MLMADADGRGHTTAETCVRGLSHGGTHERAIREPSGKTGRTCCIKPGADLVEGFLGAEGLSTLAMLGASEVRPGALCRSPRASLGAHHSRQAPTSLCYDACGPRPQWGRWAAGPDWVLGPACAGLLAKPIWAGE